jgi:branched-chain amino acid transport system permease protein
MTAGGFIAGIAGGIYAHYTTHIEQGNFNVLVATFAIAYPILGGLSSVFGTVAAVAFIQGFLVEGLRFLGDWRNLLFGALIVLAMNLRPGGLFDARSAAGLRRVLHHIRSGTALADAAAAMRRLVARWRGAFGA